MAGGMTKGMTASTSDGSHGTTGAPRPGAPAPSAARPARWVLLACFPPSSTGRGGAASRRHRLARTRRSIRCAGPRPMWTGTAGAWWARPSAEEPIEQEPPQHAQAIPSAPGAATAALASHAVCLRPHRFGPGRPGSLGRAGTPRCRTANADPAARRPSFDGPGRAGADLGVDHHAPAEHLPHPVAHRTEHRPARSTRP
jgi:hypothetical protein